MRVGFCDFFMVFFVMNEYGGFDLFPLLIKI